MGLLNEGFHRTGAAGRPPGHGYDPDEPRDWHGRWTTGSGSGRITPAIAYRGPIPMGPVGARRGLLHPDTFDFGPASRLYGGTLLRIQNDGAPGIGNNGPPEEEIPEGEPMVGASGLPQGLPFAGAPQVPQGWDIPAHVTGGLLHPPTRRPVLPNGEPWPVATHDAVKALLAPRGRSVPIVTLLIPDDGVGDMLLGSVGNEQFEQPKGYDAVMLLGTPQKNYVQDPKIGRHENGHADDGIQEAFRLAKTHQFDIIYFNRGYAMVTKGLVESRRRPDVFAVARPQFSDPHRYRPYESLSASQRLEQRQKELPDAPDIAPVYGTPQSQWKNNPDK